MKLQIVLPDPGCSLIPGLASSSPMQSLPGPLFSPRLGSRPSHDGAW
jgi:hypothetical protein